MGKEKLNKYKLNSNYKSSLERFIKENKLSKELTLKKKI